MNFIKQKPESLSIEELITIINNTDKKYSEKKQYREELMTRVETLFPEDSRIIYINNGQEFVGRIKTHYDKNKEKKSKLIFETDIEYINKPFKTESKAFYHENSTCFFTHLRLASKEESIAILMNQRSNHNITNSNDISEIFTARNREFYSENIKRIVNNETYLDSHPEFSENYFLIGIVPAMRSGYEWIEDKTIYKPVITTGKFTENNLSCVIKNLIRDREFLRELNIPDKDGYAIHALSVPECAHKVIEKNYPLKIKLTYEF